MAPRSTRSSRKGQPKARLLAGANEGSILSCGVDPASLPYMGPKLVHKNILVEGVRPYAANILKQDMLSLGGDVAIHRGVICGKADLSDCLLMGDLRHYRLLLDKLRRQPGLEPVAHSIEDAVFGSQNGLTLSLCSRNYAWERVPVVMGILNVTPDSFSDGGLWLDPHKALDHALQMVEQGAGIIDVGGESSRPGAEDVGMEEEISRTVPVIRMLASCLDVPVSIDTRKAGVASAAIEAGACMINDISALGHDPAMLEVAKETRAGLILMHMRGTPKTMQDDTRYDDVVREVYAILDSRIELCLDRGINPSSILVDPGIGFGKGRKNNLKLIHHIAEFRSLGVPVILGHSMKRFIGTVLGTETGERQGGTDAVSAWATVQGVSVLRVHNVLSTVRIRDMILAIQDSV